MELLLTFASLAGLKTGRARLLRTSLHPGVFEADLSELGKIEGIGPATLAIKFIYAVSGDI